jgi:hypothetical protein
MARHHFYEEYPRQKSKTASSMDRPPRLSIWHGDRRSENPALRVGPSVTIKLTRYRQFATLPQEPAAR